MSEIIFNSPTPVKSDSDLSLETHVDSLQTTLASLNQQVIFLQEAVQERDQEIVDLRSRASPCEAKQPDQTLTVVAALIKLFKFITSPGKV